MIYDQSMIPHSWAIYVMTAVIDMALRMKDQRQIVAQLVRIHTLLGANAGFSTAAP